MNAMVKLTADNLDPRQAFLAKRLDELDVEGKIIANQIMMPDKLSSGLLLVDWVNGGGLAASVAIISGEEQAGKTTVAYHTSASSFALRTPSNTLWDGEGTMNPDYAGRIWEPFGMDAGMLLTEQGKQFGFRYYRNNVIETLYDYMLRLLKSMPDKYYSTEAGTWTYHFPKGSDYFAAQMAAYGCKPVKALSTKTHYVCETDNTKHEGFICLDSFASMVTNEEDESGERSARRAIEAQAFSQNMRRVASRIADKGFVMLGTNQLRKIPNVVMGGPDDQVYEPGGEALKFYSAQRTRIFSRAVPQGLPRSKNNYKIGVEPSVEVDGGEDSYHYKEIKNTKNKFGVPGLKARMRAWVSDGLGRPRGFDPFWDTLEYLLNTSQIVKERKGYRFRLKNSVGAARAGYLNSLAPFTYDAFKQMVIGEHTGNTALFRAGCQAMGITKRVNLRESLFKQLRTDLTVYTKFIDGKQEEAASEPDYEEL